MWYLGSAESFLEHRLRQLQRWSRLCPVSEFVETNKETVEGLNVRSLLLAHAPRRQRTSRRADLQMLVCFELEIWIRVQRVETSVELTTWSVPSHNLSERPAA